MGKKKIKASGWTIRPVMLFLHKAVTLVFALFCVTSGLFARTASSKDETSLKGIALSFKDSTVLANIKLYLCTSIAPVYGVGSTILYSPVDSAITDSNGYFNFNNDELLYQMTVLKKDSVSEIEPFKYVSGSDVDPDDTKSDTLKLYFRPLGGTGVKTDNYSEIPPLIESVKGKRVSIKITNWNENNNYNAKIVNARGELVCSPEVSSDGFLVWNTEKVARGTYFLKITSRRLNINSKITIK